MTLQVGQKVTLSGTVASPDAGHFTDLVGVVIDGIAATYWFRADLLTPVVEPEPQWSPGDVVSIDDETYMHRVYRSHSYWSCANVARTVFYPSEFSQAWSEGRVVIIHRKEETQ